MKKIGKRLRQVRQILNISQGTLACELGITKQAISNTENSRSAPGVALLYKLCTDYGVNLNFLICGRGDMFQGYKTTAPKMLKKSLMKEFEDLLKLRGIN